MAAHQLLARMPPLTLDAGCTVTVEAIDPSTGATVTGVTITSAAVYATNTTEGKLPPPPVPRLTLQAATGGPGGT